jgi:hypothetical protein
LVAISLSLKEAEYLKSLVRADIETRENKGDYQKVAITVYEQIVVGREPVVVKDMKKMQNR